MSWSQRGQFVDPGQLPGPDQVKPIFVIDLVADSLVTQFALQIPATFKGDGCRQLRDTDEAVAFTTTTRDPWPVLTTRRTWLRGLRLLPQARHSQQRDDRCPLTVVASTISKWGVYGRFRLRIGLTPDAISLNP